MVVVSRRANALVGGAGDEAGRPVQCGSVDLSMIARLHRMGERCRRAARSACLLTRVLFVAFRGLYQSWRAQDLTADPAFRRARHAAYRVLWAKLDNVYWKLRESNGDASTLRALLIDVNAFLAENCLCVREADQELLTQYVLSLQRFRAAVCPLPNNEPAAWESPARPTPTRLVDINTVTQEAVDLRNRVLQQIRRALPPD
jgi:hypothetical protein